MKKLDKAQSESLWDEVGRLNHSYGTNPVLNAANELEIGQSLMFDEADWTPKSTVSIIFGGQFRTSRNTKRFMTRSLYKEKSGADYIVTRYQ